MPYVTSWERLGEEKGREEGRREGEEKGRRESLLESIAAGLEAKFGAEGLEFLTSVRQIQDASRLPALVKALWNGAGLDDLRRLME